MNHDQRRKDWLAKKAAEAKKVREDQAAEDECPKCGCLYDTRKPHKCPELYFD